MADKRPITTPSALAELPNTDSLIAGASAVLSEQGSSPATPASGYGIVYAKTDGKLYFKNDAGTETDLTATGGGTNPVIREYTANDTWNKPSAANFWGVMVVCVGAGSGGGSGRRGAASVVRGAGGGGAGAGYSARIIRAATLTAGSYAITIGTGGTGGAARTTNDTSGLAGTGGGNTSFGSLVIAAGAPTPFNAGGTGNTSGGSPALIQSNTPQRSPYSLGGTTGGRGRFDTTGETPITAGLNLTGGAAGGGGGAIDNLNVVRDGGGGGAIYDAGVLSSNPAGGTTAGTRNGTNGSDVANNILLDIDNATTAAMGTGGGGGAAGDTAGTIAGGNGGNGGKGAGGGGGGASTNGANSGAGGNGGDGLCFVVEYYGA